MLLIEDAKLLIVNEGLILLIRVVRIYQNHKTIVTIQNK